MNDPRSSHLEITRGLLFSLMPFSEMQWRDDHAHCIACSRDITEQHWPDAVHEGFIARVPLKYEGIPVRYQWQWVCPSCFADLRQTMEWQLTSDPPEFTQPRGEHNTHDSTFTVDDSALENGRQPYATISWTPTDIVGIAGLLDHKLSLEEAEEFLRQNERLIYKKMSGAGYESIQKLLRENFKARQ